MNLTDAHNHWLHRLDPLAGPLAAPSADGATVLRDDAHLLALARRIHVPDDEPYALFVPAVQDLLVVRSGGPMPAEVWSELLQEWDRTLDGAGTPSVRVAHRDQGATTALTQAGFRPVTTTAVRAMDGAEPPSGPDDVQVRPPETGDRDRLLDLLETMHASNLAAGCGQDLPDNRRALAHYLDEALEGTTTWAWVAETGAAAVGMLTLGTPEGSEWASPTTSLHPVCYLGLASVDPAMRGRGVARLLTEHALRRADAAGAAAVVLDHASQSPSARGCWTAQGFVPVWHTWERQR